MLEGSSPPPRPDLPGSAVPAGPSPHPGRARWIVVAAAAAVAGAILIVLLVVAAGAGAPFRLPDEIGDAARVEEGPFDVFIDAMIEDLGAANVEIDGTSYGGRFDPRYILIVSDIEGFPSGDVLSQVKTGYDSPGDEIQLEEVVRRDVGDTHFECAPTSDVTIPTTICVWVSDRTVGLLISLVSDDPEVTLELVQQAREDAEV